MIDIRAIHRKAVDLVKQANEALQYEFLDEYRTLTEEALELEKQAAYALINEWQAEPTRSVLFRSAATLAKNLNKFEEARQLVHLGLAGSPYFETEQELKGMLTDVDLSLALTKGNRQVIETDYLSYLRNNAISLRIKPKGEHYAEAIAVDSIIDFLKNVQKSYSGYFEVNFRKTFPTENDPNYEKRLSGFKQETKALCVDLAFKSFGVSIAADTRVVNYQAFYSDSFSVFKENLFENFKEEVLYADLTSNQVQQQIIEKYSPQERNEIFAPIVDSLKEKSTYSVSITDRQFKTVIKQYRAVDRRTELIFKAPPPPPAPETIASLQRTVDLIRGAGKKRILTENLSFAKFGWPITNQLEFDKKVAIFRFPYDVSIVFENGFFWINDEFYEIYLTDKDYIAIQRLYAKTLIEKFSELLARFDNQTLSFEESRLWEAMKNNIVKSW